MNMAMILVLQAVCHCACIAGDVMWHRLWLCDDSFHLGEM